MSTTNLLIAAIFCLIAFSLYFTVDRIVSRRQRIKRLEEDAKLTSINDELGFSREVDIPVELDDKPTGMAMVCEQLMRVMGINVDRSLKEERRKLLIAGITGSNAPIYLLFFKRILSFVIAAAAILLIINPRTEIKLIGFILLIVGLFGAQLYVKNRTIKRQKELLRSFPDGLDLMVVCVESGLALDAAVNRVCKELASAHPELAKELNRTRLELALLNNRAQALSNLSERTDLVAYRSLVAALIQTERFGTNLTDTLRVLSDDYRQTRLMIAEEKAGRLPALITIPLMLLLMPAFFALVLGPPFIRVWQQGGIFGGAN